VEDCEADEKGISMYTLCTPAELEFIIRIKLDLLPYLLRGCYLYL
jgi:hypothetical protein